MALVLCCSNISEVTLFCWAASSWHATHKLAMPITYPLDPRYYQHTRQLQRVRIAVEKQER